MARQRVGLLHAAVSEDAPTPVALPPRAFYDAARKASSTAGLGKPSGAIASRRSETGSGVREHRFPALATPLLQDYGACWVSECPSRTGYSPRWWPFR